MVATRADNQECKAKFGTVGAMFSVQPASFNVLSHELMRQGAVQQLTLLSSSQHHAAALAIYHSQPCSMDAAVVNAPLVQHDVTPGSPGQQDSQQKAVEGGQKRPAEEHAPVVCMSTSPSSATSVDAASADDSQDAAVQAKRRRADSPPAAEIAGQQHGQDNSSNGASHDQPPHANPQHDRSHLRQPHTLMDDADADVEAMPGPDTDKPEQDTTGAKQHKHKRNNVKSKHKPLLSFEEEEDQAPSAPAPAAEPGQHDAAGSTAAQQQQQGGGISQATTAKFKAEAKQATAARFTFRPSGSNVTTAMGLLSPTGAQQQQQRLGLVDEDETFRVAAPAGLTQIHFGMAQARGARPYQEDRHCIVTALKPSSSHAAGDGSG